jgi:hypothetical protein
MKRKAVFLAASATELVRFALIAFVAFDAGIAAGGTAGDVFRYAASAQLLFAIGFFFMWLDGPRFSGYSPLLVVGKAMNLALAAAAVLEGRILGRQTIIDLAAGPLGALPAAAILAADLFGLAVLLATGGGPRDDEPGRREAGVGRIEA